MSRPRPAGLQPQEGAPSCGTVSGQDLHSHRFLCPYYAFRVEFSDTLLGKAHFLEYLPRVLAQQRGRPAWHDLGIPKAYIVPRQPQPSYHRMLVYDNHIIGRGMRIVEEESRCVLPLPVRTGPLPAASAPDSLPASGQQSAAPGPGLAALRPGGSRRVSRRFHGSKSSQSSARQRARRSAGVSATT